MYRNISEDFTNEEFPEEFKNDLFFSDIYTSRGDDYEYESPLSIKYVQEGVEYYLVEGEQRKLSRGSCLIVNEGQNVICERSKIERDLGVSVFLKQDLLNDVFTNLVKENRDLLDNPGETLKSGGFYTDCFYYEQNSLGQFLKNLTELQSQSPDNFLAGDEFFYEISRHLFNTTEENRILLNTIKKEKLSTREEIFRRVSKGRVIIEDRLFESISIGFIAREAALSKYHFVRLFSEIFGISPYRYLLKRRIEEAQKMLKSKDISVKEVALITGFSDTSSFSKRFKKETGVSPSEFNL